jgi:short-subunit dehydrogenase
MKELRVLLTGGAGGIGLAVAASLLERGAALRLVNRDRQSLAAAQTELARDGDRVGTFSCDITDAGDRARLRNFAASWRGGMNVLINNAGVSGLALFQRQMVAQIERTLAANLTAPILLGRELLPLLTSQPRAHIVIVGSVCGSIGYPGYAVYSATKFALRRELAETNVEVHCFAPRATRTVLNRGAGEQMNAELGVTMDDPSVVGDALANMLDKRKPFAVVGWPEKLFARINALLPGLVDQAIHKQLPTIQRYATRAR